MTYIINNNNNNKIFIHTKFYCKNFTDITQLKILIKIPFIKRKCFQNTKRSHLYLKILQKNLQFLLKLIYLFTIHFTYSINKYIHSATQYLKKSLRYYLFE